jgi:Core-2/I-Branching enzyme
MAAFRLMLEAALLDPRNTVFVQVSESCFPLYHPAFIWSQLMSEAHISRVAFSPLPWYRWHDKMATHIMGYQTMRKGSQWVSLSRMHALLAAQDEHVWGQFSAYCRTLVCSLQLCALHPAVLLASQASVSPLPLF